MTFAGTALVEVPTLDEIAVDPGRVRDLPSALVVALQTRAVVVLTALWGRQLDAAGESSPSAPEDHLLNIQQAAERLCKTTDWLYRHSRELPFTVRVGHQLRFSSKGIERFIRERSGL